MENLEIIVSFAIAVINVVALAVGHYFDRFKITAICLALFDVLGIMAINNLI